MIPDCTIWDELMWLKDHLDPHKRILIQSKLLFNIYWPLFFLKVVFVFLFFYLFGGL